MDIPDIIRKHASGLSDRKLAARVSDALPGDRTISGPGVARWRNGSARPQDRDAATALATALGIDQADVYAALEWEQPGPDLSTRLDRIETTLKAYGMLTEDGEPVPPHRSEHDRLTDVIERVDPVEDDSETGT